MLKRKSLCIWKNIQDLIQVLGQPISYETTPICQGKAKLQLLVLVNCYVFKQASSTLKKYQRYKKCYDQDFSLWDWNDEKHKAVCYGHASVLAYMAKACGYSHVEDQCTRKHI